MSSVSKNNRLNQISQYIKLSILSLLSRYTLPQGKSEQSPVFIMSAGRSGSTLLRKILLRSGHVAIPPESNYFIPALTHLYVKHPFTSWEKLIDLLSEDIQTKSYLNYWNLSITQEDYTYLKYTLTPSLDALIVFFYTKYNSIHHPNAKLWGDKTPLLLYHTDTLLKTFPDAKYIFITRDGRDVVDSFLKNNIYTDLSYLCKRWTQSITIRDQLYKKKGRRLVHLVRYEDLVLNPMEEVSKICQFLDIPFDKSYLENTYVYLGDDTQDHFMRTKLPLHTDNIGKWKQSLNEVEKELIEKKIGDLLVKNGYAL